MMFSIVMLASFIVISVMDIPVSKTVVAEAVAREAIAERSEQDQGQPEKIYCNATLDDDFRPGSVQVVLDEEISDYNGLSDSFFETFFRDIEYTAIEDMCNYSDAVKNNDMLKKHFESIDFRQVISLKIPGKTKQDVLDTIKQLEEIDGVYCAEPNYIYEIESISTTGDLSETTNDLANIASTEMPAYSATPNDPRLGSLWGLTDVYGINADLAWQTTTGSPDVRVGIIDSGISEHEDLIGNLDDGWDFYNNNSVTDDDMSGHGTHVAGTIGAVGDNGLGVTGVAQNITLVPLQVSYTDSSGNNHIAVDAVQMAISYATDSWGTSEPISVLNYSVSGFGTSTNLLSMISTFPGLFVWAAGNQNTNVDTYSTIARFDLDNLISVGAIRSNGERPDVGNWGYDASGNPQGSNYGSAVDIYAPGDNILSTIPNNQYGNKSGTSMAAPHVTGAAALLKSFDPSLTGAQLKDILTDGADDITIESSNAKLLNIGNVLWNLDNPNRLQLKNVGDFEEGGGGCSGVESGWKIKVTNPQNTLIEVVYNMKMCHESDAKNWTNLSHIGSFTLSAGGSRVVEVEGNGSGTHVAFSYVSGNTRYITYANKLDTRRNRIIPGASNSSFHRYTRNGMEISMVGKYESKWLIDIKNNTGSSYAFYYNGKMCYTNDAQNWTGLTDIKKTSSVANGATVRIEISENASATDIAISYISGNKRKIFYAHNLDAKGTMTSNGSEKDYYSYTQNGMTVSISGKNGNTWLIELTNNTGSGRTFYYNAKLCYAGDAQNWNLPIEDERSVYLANGATTSQPLQISENMTATSIAICYKETEKIRKIFYAYDLDSSGTMTSFSDEYNEDNPPDECLVEGTLITLADGTQKAVEELTGTESLLVWNMETGEYDSAPIMFVDSEPIGHYEVIGLTFSDGRTVGVVAEHGFWDVDLNEYVYLDENADDFIGHDFVVRDGAGRSVVTLTDVDISTEVTTVYSPVTYGHLCYFANGMLTMPGGIEGLFNIFEVDPDTLTIDEESYASDIAEYGLYTYEEFAETFPISEEVFEAFNGQYLKVSMGKGLITEARIGELIARYAEFF